LRQRLRSFGDDVDIATPVNIRRASVRGVHGIDMVMATKAIETCHKVTRLLRESGQRIGLVGQWWSAARKRSDVDDDVETMTKQFCNTVEVRKLCTTCVGRTSFSYLCGNFICVVSFVGKT
jgi:hypothetical protein